LRHPGRPYGTMCLMHDEHFEKLLKLIELEREAERAENERKLDKLPVQAREALGKTVTRLVITREDFGVGGHLLWVLSRPSQGEDVSPFQALNQGDLVSLSFQDLEIPRIRGTLYDVDQFEITVSLDGLPPLDEPPKGKCQLDVLGSEATFKRMKKALAAVQKSEKKDIARLREIFMGAIPAEFEPSATGLTDTDSDVIPAKAGIQKDEESMGPGLRRGDGITFFNSRLNDWQREAVLKSLAAKDVALVHGPPGTGKTTVLVEIIRQAVARGQRVLASAPSNIAVDNLLEKLLDTGLKVVRMGHPARILDSLRHATLSALVAEHPEQKYIAELDEQRERLIHERSRAIHRSGIGWAERHQMQKEINALWQDARDMEYSIGRMILADSDVVLVTHGGIAKPILKKSFDLLIMDEASQATEPLSWVPITQARKVVFAGDPLQLPPTIYSEEVKKQGLGITLFERLQKILPEEAQTLLRIQYRMHETIMGFSSNQFYGGALVADESVRSHTASEIPTVQTTELTRKPLIYVDTAGASYEETWNDLLESRENEGEAKLALYLYQQLRDAGIPARHIAMITPYVAQARLLKSLAGGDKSVEIGSIDGYQGREKEAIILSLVRSNDRGEVGFLGDTRRMNVGMTRARRLLIVLGDSATLARHPFYLKFIEYADAHDAHHSAWEWINR
jgi:ATP-dependent RNA/DNA helicase IGHMBP2